MKHSKGMALLMAAVMTMTMFPTGILAAEATETDNSVAAEGSVESNEDETSSEKCGDNLTWTLDEEGVLTITGTGATYDYSGDVAPWYNEKDSINSIVIENGVTEINYRTFAFCSNLRTITFSDTVTKIYDNAFQYSTNLKNVILPSNLMYIGVEAFADCNSLEEVTIPASVTEIKSAAFSGCSSSLVIKGYTGSLAETYANENGIDFVRIDETTPDDSDNQFEISGSLYEGENRVGIDEEEITYYSFTPSKDGTYAIYSTGEEDAYAFLYDEEWNILAQDDDGGDDSNFKLVFSLTAGRTYYVGAKFHYSSISGSMTIVCEEYIISTSGKCGDSLLWDFDEVGTLTISGSGPMDDYWKDAPWFDIKDMIKTIVIENGVTSIGIYAFGYCSHVNSITIPDSVTAIGRLAFYNCEGLEEVLLPKDLGDIEDNIFCGCESLKNVYIPEGIVNIKDSAFKDCTSLKNVIIPNSTEVIEYSAFENCRSLEEVIIPQNVDYLGAGAFQNCTSLKNIVISEGVSSISGYTFAGCTNLETITIPESMEYIGYYAFSDCINLQEVEFKTKAVDIVQDAFINTPWYENLSDIAIVNGLLLKYNVQEANITIPDGVTCICGSVFADNTVLESIFIPEGVTYIGSSAFSGCIKLTEVTIPDSVTYIGELAFYQCQKLENVIIPEGVKEIGLGAFAGCQNLHSVEIPQSVTLIGDWAFGYKYAQKGDNEPREDFEIIGYAGSAAEEYARENRLTFIDAGAARDISTCTITVDDATYTGEALTPAVTVKDGDTTLEKDTDYTLEYKNNVNAGTGTVTITGKEKYTGSVDKTFTIEKADQTMTVTIANTAIKEGATASISTDGIGTLTYASSDEKVAEVDENGVVSGKGAGTAVITVTAGGNENYKEVSGTVEVTVDHAWEEDYQIDKEPTCTEEGCKSIHCAYCGAKKDEMAIPASGHHLTHVEAKDATTEAEGNIEYWYCSECDKYFKDEACTIEISKEETIIPKKVAQLEAIELDQSSAELVTSHKDTGDSTLQLKVTALPEGAAVPELTWTSSNEKVATVDQNGKVTALTYGKTTITVTAKENSSLTASCTIQTRYYDVDPAKYWYKHVYWAADKGITTGFENIYFGPEMNCTREQMITFLYREAGKPAVSSTDIKKYNTFSDVASGKYYEKAVVWAAKNGITKGYTSGPNKGKFGVGFEVTREDTVTFLYRMAKTASSKFTDVTSEDLNNKTYTFTDVVSGKYYQKAIVWAAKNGITKGYSSGENKGKFGVGFNVLRGDIVTFLSRYDSKF